MRRVLFGALFLLVCGGLMSQDVTVTAQNTTGTRAKILKKAEIEKGLARGATGAQGILAGQTVPVGEELVVRRRLAGPNNASVHSTVTDGEHMTEVMVITEGSATLMLGGTYVDQTAEYGKKDRSKGLTGGLTYEVAAGSVIVVPPGVPHWFSKINGQVTMVEVRYAVSAPLEVLSKADLAVRYSAVNWGIGGQAHSIIPASKPTNANSVVVRHREKNRPNDASIHSSDTDDVNATEVMIVLEGGGTFMTNGTYNDPAPDYRKKDRTKGITGGVVTEVQAGDILVYPPGTSHWFSNIPEQVTMIELRIPGDITSVK